MKDAEQRQFACCMRAEFCRMDARLKVAVAAAVASPALFGTNKVTLLPSVISILDRLLDCAKLAN